PLRRQVDHQRPGAPDGEPRHRAHFPEPRDVRHDERAPEHHGGGALSLEGGLPRQLPRPPGRAFGGSTARAAGRRTDRRVRARALCRPPRRRIALRHPEAGRIRPRARRRTEAPPARRARRRPEPRGALRAGGHDPHGHQQVRNHRAARRAPHEPRDGSLRPHRRAELRCQDRGRHARADPVASGRGRGVPGRAGGVGALMSRLLAVRNLEASYGQSKVLFDIAFDLEEGGITAILGANGAGKTTTLRALCQVCRTSGSIKFQGKELVGMATEDVVRLGVGHVPDGRGTFTGLSVEENLRLGAYVRRDKRAVAEDIERMYERFPRLRERRHQQAGTLSGGEQQMLAISRALMLRPRLLLLDEPSFGLAPLIVAEIFEIMRRINAEDGVSMLLVEQNASIALDLADHAYLLETGRMVISG